MFSTVRLFEKIDNFEWTSYVIGTMNNQSTLKLVVIGRSSGGVLSHLNEFDSYATKISSNSFKVAAERLRRSFFVAYDNKVDTYILQAESCFGQNSDVHFCASCTKWLDPLKCSSCNLNYQLDSSGSTCWLICQDG